MLPFVGKPIVFHLINSLRLQGFSDIIFTSPGVNGEIKDYFLNGEKLGVNIDYYCNENQAGTAGTINNLVNDIGDRVSNPFMVIYGDSLIKVDYKRILQFHKRNKSWCTILYHRPKFESFPYQYHDNSFDDVGERKNYGVMDVDSNQRVIKVLEKPPLKEICNFNNPVANAAVYVLEKRVLQYIPKNAVFDFPKNLFPILIREQMPCFGVDVEDGYRIDVGTPKNYYNTSLAVLKHIIDFVVDFPSVDDNIFIGNKSSIAPNSKLEKPVVVCKNSKINSNAVVTCSIIGNHVTIGESAIVRESIICDNTFIGKGVTISHSIIGEHCIIGDGISFPSNAIIGSYCNIGECEIEMDINYFNGLLRR